MIQTPPISARAVLLAVAVPGLEGDYPRTFAQSIIRKINPYSDVRGAEHGGNAI